MRTGIEAEFRSGICGDPFGDVMVRRPRRGARMSDLDLCALVELRHPSSWGSVTIDSSPAGITACHHTETIDDAIGLVASALSALLERRSAAAAMVNAWLPEGIRG